jgi:signal transduction histidine kinase/CheY-like chemotaxis protein
MKKRLFSLSPAPEGAKAWRNGLTPLALAIALRWILEPVLQDKSPFLLFTLGVMAAGLHGGARVGVTATAIGAFAGLFFLAESRAPRALLGSGRWVQLLLYLLACAGITYFLGRLRSYRRQTETFAIEQARLAEDLGRANSAKDDFLATLSHELRTPLVAILGWSDVLMRYQLSEEVRSAVASIHRNARAQNHLIGDLLDLSRITNGKLRLEPRMVAPEEPVAAAAETVRPAARAKKIDLRVVAHPAGTVWGDPERLQQVVWNLLANAVKFTPDSGRVTVTVQARGGRVCISVDDTGPGLSPEFIPHAFDRFRQDDASRTRTRRGLGLGLAIVRQLVEMHGGGVSAANAVPGPGAVFEVVLPQMVRSASAMSAAAAQNAEEEARGQPASLSGVRVLVVDDEPDARDLIRSALKSLGADVSAAESVSEALDAIRSRPPHVILTDIAMPNEDGYDLLRQARAIAAPESASIPAAAISAYAGEQERTRALEAGFAMHLAKPVTVTELARAVRTLIGRA